MVQNHLSRLASPKTWELRRKTTKWIAKPMPGPHSLNGSFTLSFLLREMLEYAKTGKEISTVLHDNNILVDGVVRKDKKFPVGLMDVVEVAKLDEHYRVVYNRSGRFSLIPISKDESGIKLLKVVRKTMIKGGKLQVTLHDGKNILVDKFSGNVGDSILFDLKKKHIDKILNLDKGSLVYLSSGSHVGRFGKVKGVIKAKDLQKPKVIVDIDGTEYITLAEYAFVVGKDKSEINLEVKK